MRIKLKKGKQKEFLNLIKTKEKVSWSGLARKLGIRPSSLSAWRTEKTLVPLNVFKKYNEHKRFKKYIIELKGDNWGKRKGGSNSRGTLKSINIPKKCPALAEFMGILAGDGNSYSLRRGKKVGVYTIRIAGDSRHDKEYLEEFVANLGKDLFKLNPKLRKLKGKNALHLVFYSKQLVNLLSDIGFPSGDKIKNNIGIPSWIKNDRNLLKAYIRGVIDTDGSIFRMSNKDPNLIRIGFTNHNPKLLNECRQSFEKLRFKPSKIIRGKKFVISRKENISRYLEEIGFNNPKHIKRANNFMS